MMCSPTVNVRDKYREHTMSFIVLIIGYGYSIDSQSHHQSPPPPSSSRYDIVFLPVLSRRRRGISDAEDQTCSASASCAGWSRGYHNRPICNR